MNVFSWEARIARAAELARVYPFSSEILGFYGQVAAFQQTVFERLSGARMRQDPGLEILPPHFQRLLSLIGRIGPAGLAESANALLKQKERWMPILNSYWSAERTDYLPVSEAEIVLVQALLQPYAEYLASRRGIQSDAAGNTCPFCEELPHVGALRPEGEGAKRSLICGLCATEWPFRRMLCPHCGEEAVDKLPVYVTGDFEHVRVEACDTCGVYIKSVDLTKAGHAVPIVDELATTPLNAWAEERGYAKLCPNLLGM